VERLRKQRLRATLVSTRLLRGASDEATRQALAGSSQLGVRPSADEAILTRIAVTPGAQGRGIADALMGHAIDRARALGAHRLTLDVHILNARARAFYARHGFRRIGAGEAISPHDGSRVVYLHLARSLAEAATGCGEPDAAGADVLSAFADSLERLGRGTAFGATDAFRAHLTGLRAEAVRLRGPVP
jgi:hypothetical protein